MNVRKVDQEQISVDAGNKQKVSTYIETPKNFESLFQFSLLIVALIIICTVIGRGLFLGVLSFNVKYALVILVGGLIYFTFIYKYVHEFFHWLPSKILKYSTRVFIMPANKEENRKERNVCIIRGKIRNSHFRLIIILPLVVDLLLSLLLLISAVITSDAYIYMGFILYLTMSLGSASSDIYLFVASLHPKNKGSSYKCVRSSIFRVVKRLVD
ncbi:hypothetical protein ACWE42_11180 [Sutcliffiella cohnii]